MLFPLLPIRVSPSQTSSVLIRYKYKAGDSVLYSNESKTDIHTTADGKDIPMLMTMKSQYTQSVKSVGQDGTGMFEIKYLSFKMLTNGASQPTPPGLLDHPVKMKMSPTGKVESVAMEGAPNPPGFDINSIQTLSQLPQEAVHVGSHWTVSFDMAAVGHFDLASTLTKIEDKNGKTFAYINGKSKADMGAMLTSMGKVAGFSGTGTVVMESTMVFNVTDGCIESNHTESTFDATLKMIDPNSTKGPLLEKGTQTMDQKRMS